MTDIPKPSGKIRWIVCALLFGAVVLSYVLILSIIRIVA